MVKGKTPIGADHVKKSERGLVFCAGARRAERFFGKTSSDVWAHEPGPVTSDRVTKTPLELWERREVESRARPEDLASWRPTCKTRTTEIPAAARPQSSASKMRAASSGTEKRETREHRRCCRGVCSGSASMTGVGGGSRKRVGEIRIALAQPGEPARRERLRSGDKTGPLGGEAECGKTR